MSILRLSILSLTLAIAVFSLGYVNSSSAAPKKCDGAPAGTPGCGGGSDGDTNIGCATCEYTARLIGTVNGAFEFGSAVPVDVTPNAKETSLQFDTNPTVTPRGGSTGPGTDWYDVFTDCLALGPTPFAIPTVFAVESVIDKPGGVRVAFFGIEYGTPQVDEVSVVVQLIGTTPFEDPFLPEKPTFSDIPTMIDHVMSISLVQGHTVKEIHPKGHCNKTGRTGTVDSTLTIISTDPTLDPAPP